VKPDRRRPDRRRTGLTLGEVTIVCALLAVALGSLTLFGSRSVDTLGSGAIQGELDARLRRTVSRIGDELLSSGLGVITPDAAAPAGADTLTYRRSDGVVNGTIRWGAPHRLAFEYERGEIDDGLDNNGNGLVDEGVVAFTVDVGQPGELGVILCHDVAEYAPGETDDDADDNGNGVVDERGFSFERVDGALRVRLTLARLDPQGRPISRTLETMLQPRN